MEAILSQFTYLYQTDSLLYSFLLLLFKASLVLLAGIFILYGARNGSAARRHLLATFSLLSLLLLAPLSFLLPAIEWSILPPALNTSITSAPANVVELTTSGSDTQASTSPLSILVLATYFTGAFILLTRMTRRLIRSHALLINTGNNDEALTWGSHAPHKLLAQLQSTAAGCRRTKLVYRTQVETPVTFGFFRPTIVWPNDAQNWPEEGVRSALLHELAHIRRLDWLTLLLAETACSLFWCLPMAWMLRRQMILDAEYAADDWVLKQGQKASTYATQLLAVVERLQQRLQQNDSTSAIPLVTRAALYHRVESLLDIYTKRNPVSASYCYLLAVPTLALLMSIAAIQTSTIEQTTPRVSQLLDNTISWLSLTKEPVTEIEPSSKETIFNAAELKTELLSASAGPTSMAPTSYGETLIISGSPFDGAAIGSSHIEAVIEPLQMPNLSTQTATPWITVTPVYPSSAQRRGIEGHVVARFDIDAQGIPQNITIIDARPDKVFNRAVINALRRSRYRPQIIAGGATGVKGLTSKIIFQLKNSAHNGQHSSARHIEFNIGYDSS